MTEYRGVQWSDDELITADKLNQMTTNDKYLFEHAMPQMYRAYGLNKTDGLRVAAGIITINSQAWREARSDISFNGFFTQGCRPVVQATVAITDQVRCFCIVKGIGPSNVRPDHTGFTVIVNADPVAETKNYFPMNFHVHWLALGY